MGAQVDAAGRPTTCSGGGPVIALPAEVAAAWRGTDPPVGATVPPGWTWGKSGGPVCDYDRACDAPYERTEWAGFARLDVGGRSAIALDAELVTVWIAEADGGYLLRGNTVDGPATDPSSIPEDGWRIVGDPELELADGRLFVFDSAFPGAADPEDIRAHDGVAVAVLGPGRWSVRFGTNGHGTDFVRFRRA